MWGLWEEGLDYTAETLGGRWVAGSGARDFKILLEVPCLQPLVATKRQNDFCDLFPAMRTEGKHPF